MCIRDRDYIAHIDVPTGIEQVTIDPTNRLGDAYKVNDHLAVSYTHLRAHETVLDLVCRLLLEKKKSTVT